MEATEAIIKAELRRYISQTLLAVPSLVLADDQSLINGGVLDSFALLDVAVFIEERFGVVVPDHLMEAEMMDTLDLMTATVVRLGTDHA